MHEKIKERSLITAVKTPFKADGAIDLEAYEKFVRRQIKHGVQGLVVGGTTGEGHLLSWDEHIMLIGFSVNKFGNELLIIGNTGSNNTREAINATEQGFAVGMHASLQINPYYGKTSKSGLLKHYGKTLDVGPCIIYNVPSRTAQDIEPDIIEALAEHKNFIGVKECAGNERIKAYAAKGISCWSGNDQECADAKHKSGARGVISVASNFYPAAFREIMDDPNSSVHGRLTAFLEMLYAEPNPIGLNTLLAMSGLTKPVLRLPYVPLDGAARNRIREEVLRLNLPETPSSLNLLKDEEFILV